MFFVLARRPHVARSPPQRAASSAVPRTSRRFRTPFAPPAPGAPRIWRCAELLPLWAESWRPRTRAEHCSLWSRSPTDTDAQWPLHGLGMFLGVIQAISSNYDLNFVVRFWGKLSQAADWRQSLKILLSMFLQQLGDLNPETIHPYLSPNHPNLDALKKSSNCCDKRPSTHHPHHQNHPFPTFYNFGFLKIGLFTICFSPSISSISQHIHPCIPSTKKSGSRSGSRTCRALVASSSALASSCSSSWTTCRVCCSFTRSSSSRMRSRSSWKR